MTKLTKAFWLPLSLLAFAAAPLSAASYVAKLSGPSGLFGYPSSLYYTPPSMPTPAAPTPTPSTPAASTLMTASCLYGPCGSPAPGMTPPPSSPMSSFAPSAPSAYTYSLPFSGAVSRYSVFGVYTFSPTAFGRMPTPVFAGGLASAAVVPTGAALATNPEPTSIALFGAGLFALGWASRRRKNRKS